MVRPKKAPSDLQTEKVVVYVTPETKQLVKEAAEKMQSSESKIGDQAIQSWLKKRGETTMPYLTGPLNGADFVFQRPVDIPFSCELDGETWDGTVTWVANHGSHVEFNVQARGSGFRVIAGQTLSGWFMAFPVHEVCLDLAAPTDVFYNKEKALACEKLNRIDGISAVQALRAVYKAGHLGNGI